MKKDVKYYNKNFYREQKDGSFLSAQILLPVVFDIFHPSSVVDIGCGVGYWLKVCNQELGIHDVLGVEGNYMTEDLFQLDKKYLQTADLRLPLELNRKFDIAISMEVAEHIPEESSDIFISNLVNAADIILFSAAIVAQLGTNHINEQMPEYWAKKFLAHNYIPIDFVRPKIWNDEGIEYWYRQNAIIYLKKERLIDFPELKFAAEATDPNFLLRIHPEKYFAYVNETRQLSSIPGFIRNKADKVIKWIKSHRK